ncbi:PIG-L family deacetylase [Candidatus Woesearchaeota archaeon]|nr:PIG-L family deacetylase [Candidatus Woesearchaeota archaeon]
MSGKFIKSEHAYRILTAHPDDEILISGLLQRLISTGSNIDFACLTDGNQKVSGDIRIKELEKSLSMIGYEKPLNSMLEEKKIYDAVLKGDNEGLLGLIEEAAASISQGLEAYDRLLVPDFSGGHFIHDLVHYLAAASVKKNHLAGKCAIYEYPQIYLAGADNLSIEDALVISEHIREGRITEFRFRVIIGELCPKKYNDYPDDKNIGMADGRIELTEEELSRKGKQKEAHESQKEHLDRYKKDYDDAHKRSEIIRWVPPDTDYTKKPMPGPCLYEVCSWRKKEDQQRIVNFEDFRRVVELTENQFIAF